MFRASRTFWIKARYAGNSDFVTRGQDLREAPRGRAAQCRLSRVRLSNIPTMRPSRPNIWLLSAYHADSHAAWSGWLTQHMNAADWRLVTLPGRHFRWRIRGNPLSWLDQLPDETPDLILATAMVDLATLKGLYPRLAKVRCLYYFHENQFAYPRGEGQHSSVDPQMVQLYGALAADLILFNSRFNRDSFLAGIDDLLRRLPDQVPEKVSERLLAKSSLLPVAIECPSTISAKDGKLILWNHRWEYDKDPELFAQAMLRLAERGLEFRLALLGARPQRTPAALQQLRTNLPERIIADGRLARDEYKAWLNRSSIAVSTARHEFQGLAMLEAAAHGAAPLVPDALCYPEQYPAQHRYKPGDLNDLIERLSHWLAAGPPTAVDTHAWQTPCLLEPWRRILGLS